MTLATRDYIERVKRRALRTRIWFKALSRLERAIVDLTLKCVEKVRSPALAEAIMSILSKITQGDEIRFLAKAEQIGRPIAQKLSIIAERWGNQTSSAWENDSIYVRYLGITAIYAQA